MHESVPAHCRVLDLTKKGRLIKLCGGSWLFMEAQVDVRLAPLERQARGEHTSGNNYDSSG
ncbi:hypothetical protein A2U01_0026083 [Trifolium medium]|uniref:Uncharacterized protein n=1 Tax=Trifolium medium TaxID=97028 RepID=A0A392NZZ7_9FABA|nr:hypothetical protein [Trifolium medium]